MTQNYYLNKLGYLSRLEKSKQLTSRRKSDIAFTEFKRKFWEGYVHTDFHEIIDAHLTKVYEYIETGEGINRLMVCMPPRYGKTRSVSKMFPAWMLGKNPNLPMILTGYGARLPKTSSAEVRNLINEVSYQQLFPATRLTTDTKAKDQWNIEGAEGGMVTAGVGGGLTGFGGRLIIIDDPIKSRADAESKLKRDNIKDWYNNDLYTRLNRLNHSAIVIINTRWHHDDLSGWLLSNNIDDWTVLNFPAIAAEPDDLLGRTIGQPLWSELQTLEELEQLEAQIGSYAFEALYQQNPQLSKGQLFNIDAFNNKMLDEAPEIKYAVRFYDLAATAKARSSYTVGFKLGLTYRNDFVILDVFRVQAELADVHKSIMRIAKQDGTDVPIIIEAEKGGIVELQFLHREPEMNGYSMSLQTPKGDKYTRATPIASKVNAGRVAMLKANWNIAFLDEISTFPNGTWDDQVDAFSGAYKAIEEGYYEGDGDDISDFLANYRGFTSG